MAKDTFLNAKRTLNVGGELVDLSIPKVMGILNITTDSFYENSRSNSIDNALSTAETFMMQGATFIDIGAYSSRPGASNVSAAEEISRLIPVINAIAKRLPQVIISIDTFRADVAKMAIEAGAHMINDISAGNLDPEMFSTVANLQVPYVAMHMKGNPATMQGLAQYENISLELVDYFSDKVSQLQSLGVKDIIIDPGFGFAKTLDHNYVLLNNLEDLHIFNLPLLVGVSRKSMIYKLFKNGPEEALNGTTVINTLALIKGAAILRVHDVKAAAECIAIVKKMQQ